jgi:AcrR family transcriptional regulator
MPEPPKKLRGRPRNNAANLKVLEAARDLLAEGGIAAVTIEELAARAGISRPTIYRSWPNAKAVAMAALIEAAAMTPETASRGSVRHDLKRVVNDLVTAFATPVGRSAAELIAAADHSTELAKAFRHHLLLKVRERVLEVLAAGVKRGDIRKRLDLEAAADLVMAPVFFRLMVGHHQLDADFAETIVEQVLHGLSA